MSALYYDWIANHALRRPESLAAIDLGSGRRFTYAQFHERIGRLASVLCDKYGVKRGDRVAVFAPNTTETFEVQFAAARLGAIFVPLNWRLAVPELRAILSDCAPVVLIHDAEFADRAEAFTGMRLCAFGGPGSVYEQALAAAAPLAVCETVLLTDISTILYTSGTTGVPKGVIITHAINLWNTVNGCNDYGLNRESVFLGVLPLFHTGGLNVWANPAFHYGAAVIIMRAFDPGEALRLIDDPALGITHMFGVPAIFQFMGAHPSFATTDLSRLVGVGVGGAPTPLTILNAWAERGVLLQQAFGMTETSPLVLILDKEDATRKIGSACKPVMHGQIKIVREDGADAGDDEIGELWVRGEHITPGYWQKPDITAAAFTDGWLHTGDAARRDSDGFYYIVDRWKDMYISGGENVYPAEVENVLYQIPAVAEACVIGVANERWGEVGRAVVVVKPDMSLSEDDVIAHCAANLARYKLPHSVVFTDALPRNATGKVHKPTLRTLFGG